MADCIFCKIVSGEMLGYKVYENEHVLAFLDAFPHSKGHTLVIPKKHFVNIFDVDDKTTKEVFSAVRLIANAVHDAIGSDGIKLVMASEKAAGQVVFHMHVHIIPKNEGEHGKYEENDFENIAEKIKEKLQ